MKKIILILSVLALLVSGYASVKTNDTETTAKTEETSDFIEYDKLKKKSGIYYLNNVPFTGKAKKVDETSDETWEMKDGKFHGKYFGDEPNGSVTGYYKDGKKHGEWEEFHEPYDTYNKKIETYKEGKKHGEWKYFRVEQRWINDEELKFIDHLIKTEIWENDKLIKEWTKEDEEVQNEDTEPWFGIDFDKLVLKDDVYYLNNVPFTGKAGYQKEMHESWEFKDGKFHGEYHYYFDGCTTNGNYRNGKKHGKWEGWCYDYDEDKKIDMNTEMWEDGELISELNDDDKHSGYLNAGDFQLYSIRVAQSSTVEIEGDKSSDNIAIYLNVYSNDDDDVFVTSQDVNYLTFYAGAGKTYFIRITGSSSDISGAYSITVRVFAVPSH